MRMKFSPLVLLFALLPLVFAFSNNGLAKLEGKWVVDRDAMVKIVKSEEPEASSQEIKEIVDSLADAFVLDFDTSKQEIRIEDGEDTDVAQYTVVSESNKEMKIKIDSGVLVITMTGNNSFSLKEEKEGATIPMIRAKK